VSYGNKGNEELLFQYGFSLPNNPFDTVMVLAPLHSEDPLMPDKLQLLSALHLSPRIFFSEEGFTDNSREIARPPPLKLLHSLSNSSLLCSNTGIALLEESEFSEVERKMSYFEETGNWESGQFSIQNEAHVLHTFSEILKERLSSLKENPFPEWSFPVFIFQFQFLLSKLVCLIFFGK